MFGYQVHSSDTAGIGDIYENTKGGHPQQARHSGSIKSGKGSRSNAPRHQKAASNSFAAEDESILQQTEP